MGKRLLLVLAGVALAAGGCARSQAPAPPSLAPLSASPPAVTSQLDRPHADREPAPELAVTAFDGQTIRLRAWTGRPVLVNFFESWCPQCREEQPGLNQVATQFKGRVRFVGVSYHDNAGNGRAYQRDYRVPYPLANDRSGRTWNAWGVPYQPVTVFVDRHGRIAARVDGQVQASRVRATLTRLLEERD